MVRFRTINTNRASHWRFRHKRLRDIGRKHVPGTCLNLQRPSQCHITLRWSAVMSCSIYPWSPILRCSLFDGLTMTQVKFTWNKKNDWSFLKLHKNDTGQFSCLRYFSGFSRGRRNRSNLQCWLFNGRFMTQITSIFEDHCTNNSLS